MRKSLHPAAAGILLLGFCFYLPRALSPTKLGFLSSAELNPLVYGLVSADSHIPFVFLPPQCYY